MPAIDIAAWAMITVAAEPYLVSAMGTFMPLLLEQLARTNGVSAIDHLTPCAEQGECVLPILGGYYFIDTASYALYTFSVAVFFQTICILTMSGIADNSRSKKKLIVIFGTLGGSFACLFLLITTNNFYLSSVLAICGNCCFGVVNVLTNSYMILLINNEQQVKQTIDEETGLIDEGPADADTLDVEIGKLRATISGYGTSSGYFSALIVQIMSLFSLLKLKSHSFGMIESTKILIAFIGVYWLIWQIPIGLFLRNYSNGVETNMSIKSMIKKGYVDICHAVKSIEELKHVFFFLTGWFVLSDSISTINSTAMLFAKTSLNMPMSSITIMSILVMISAISGSIMIPRYIIAKHQWDLQTVLIGIILWCLLVPLYSIFFLKNAWEFYILGIWYGIGIGGLNTVSRSVYSIIIPSGKESIFFSLFALTDKGSSIIGPFVIGLIIDVLHDLKMAFWILAALLLLSLPILGLQFNLHEGRVHAANYRG